MPDEPQGLFQCAVDLTNLRPAGEIVATEGIEDVCSESSDGDPICSPWSTPREYRPESTTTH
eukprot:6800322-Karenia_brevis.AAC.1